MMDIKTKNFILNSLLNAVKQVQSSIDVKDRDKTEQLYEIHLNYIYKTLDVVIKDSLPTEHQLIKNEIELIDSKADGKLEKMIEICKKLIDLGKRIIANY